MKCPNRRRITVDQGIGKKIKILVGCGKCIYCKASLKLDLVFRMEEEGREWDFETQYFTTLTYEHMPHNSSLNYAHVRSWLDRVKKAWGKKFSYFVVGEYGAGEGHRPHWHILSWGIPQYILVDKWYEGFVDTGS